MSRPTVTDDKATARYYDPMVITQIGCLSPFSPPFSLFFPLEAMGGWREILRASIATAGN